MILPNRQGRSSKPTFSLKKSKKVIMRSLLLLFPLISPTLSIGATMNMAVAWFNVNEEPGTCSAQEGAAISALMIPAVNNIITSLSVIGGGRAWDSGDGEDEDRRDLLEYSPGLEFDKDEERELCAKCRNVCYYNIYECKFVYNCCPCGYCRRLSIPEKGVSASVVASSLEIACEGVLQGITSMHLSADISSACMESLKGSECKADVSRGK